jgi:acyl-CoA reductase-like NAD-dependent aldehyde dehydrogenase
MSPSTGSGRRSTTVINPADETVIAEVPHTPLEAVDEAVARAVNAQKSWAALAPVDRARALRRFADAVDGAVEELARLEVQNSGHPIGSARWEAGHVRDVLSFAAGMPERLNGSQIPVAGGIDVTFHEPLGVVGVIVPWNFPMTIASWGFAPALAAGNAVLLKPADWTPLTAIRLGELALESGLPEHLFQVLPGRGSVVGERFVTHPEVRKIVFTGSTEVGKRVAAGCAEQVKPVTLELGGKSANIVFADADLGKAAATAPGSVFDNAGQDCCARSRLLVERSVLDRFLELLEPAVQAWRVGDPSDEATEMGPLVSSAHRDSVQGFLDDAPVAFRGTAPDGAGYWMAPTVLLPGRNDRVATEEIFGPVVSVLPFDDEADAIALANSSIYGLSGSIWTRDLGRGIRVARGVESGNLSVNSHSSVRYTTPFGGMKQSGLGRELGPDAALPFTETKNVFFSQE